MKKFFIAATFALASVCAYSQNKNTPVSYQIGYAYSTHAPFNWTQHIKWGDQWGMFTNFGMKGTLFEYESGIDYGYNTEVIYDRFESENRFAVVGGVAYRIIKKIPFYVSAGIGYGSASENWEKYTKYNFNYLPDEYQMKSYIKPIKSGFAYQLGVQYDFHFGQYWLMGIEIFHNNYLGVGFGISLGVIM